MTRFIAKSWITATSLLRSEDGMLSFSKVMLVLLVGGWLAGRTLEASLALVFIVASHGRKTLRDWLQRSRSPKAPQVRDRDTYMEGP